MIFRDIEPFGGVLEATVDAPPSKSLTHRALIVAALARGTSTIERPLDAEDASATVAGLRALGVSGIVFTKDNLDFIVVIWSNIHKRH